MLHCHHLQNNKVIFFGYQLQANIQLQLQVYPEFASKGTLQL